MKQASNSLTLSLICSSIALLLVLQFLWLRSSYTRAFDDLRRESNNVFRNTIFTMRDSLIQQAFEVMQKDSTATPTRSRRRIFWEGADAASMPDSNGMDAVFEGKRSGARVVVYPNSVRIRRDSGNHRRPSMGRRDYMFRFTDSLRQDSIRAHFGRSLKRSGYSLPFQIVQVKRTDKHRFSRDSFISETVRFNPQRRYAVVLSGYRSTLLRQIMPQALFSIFLTLITVLAFYILYKSIRTQQQLVQLKNDFISNITHELKTPITTVSVAIEALENFKGINNPELTREYLSIARGELNRLAILTDKILKTAVYEDKRLSFRKEPVNMEGLVDQVLESFKLTFEKNATAVTLEKSGRDFTVQGDHDHLLSVIYNLIDNAQKYSGRPPMLAIDLKETAAGVQLFIGDNGPGIPVEYRMKIFEKFFRVPTGDVHNVKGYGLGLSYADLVVRGHNGSIEVTGKEGQGSVFILTLPRA